MDNSNEAIAMRWDLNRRIARARGWQVVKLDKPEIYEGNDERGGRFRIEAWWTVVDGNNQPMMSAWQDAELVLEHAPWPNCTEELETAITLFQELPSDYTPRLVRIVNAHGELGFFWRAMIIDNKTHVQWEGEAADPAMAISLCWLDWNARA